MNKLSKFKNFFLYFNAVLLLILLGAGTYYTISLYSKAQSCFTVEQVQQSADCLFIYNTSVYKKGTRAEPHQGNTCGTDVTALIPESHMLDKVGHLDPNYQGEICANAPLPTVTQQPSPTTAPTDTPAPSATPIPANAQAPSPTSVPNATLQTPLTATPTQTPTPINANSLTPTLTVTPEPTTLTTLPVTGRLEWLVAAMIPVGLVVIGIIL